MNLSNYELFYDVRLEVIGFQLPPYIKDSGSATIGGKADKTATNEEDYIKKQRDMASI
jgi:hypothetical protein